MTAREKILKSIGESTSLLAITENKEGDLSIGVVTDGPKDLTEWFYHLFNQEPDLIQVAIDAIGSLAADSNSIANKLVELAIENEIEEEPNLN